MIKAFSLVAAALLALVIAPDGFADTDDAAHFESLKTKTLDKDNFKFPEDLTGGGATILLVAMSEDRDSGQEQQQVLLDWHAALDKAGAYSDPVRPFHLIVMPSPPFFVKGLIARALRDAYKDKVPFDRAAIVYTKDLPGFARAAAIPVDNRPTIVLVSSDGAPVTYFKGDATAENISAVLNGLQELEHLD